jgi:hypothetical protein
MFSAVRVTVEGTTEITSMKALLLISPDCLITLASASLLTFLNSCTSGLNGFTGFDVFPIRTEWVELG